MHQNTGVWGFPVNFKIAVNAKKKKSKVECTLKGRIDMHIFSDNVPNFKMNYL